MGRFTRFATRTAEAIHNVTSEPIADAGKYVGSKIAEAKDAVSEEHAIQEAKRQARKEEREAEKAAERAKVEAEKANSDLLNKVISTPPDPQAAAAFLRQMADLAEAQLAATEQAKPSKPARAKKATAKTA